MDRTAEFQQLAGSGGRAPSCVTHNAALAPLYRGVAAATRDVRLSLAALTQLLSSRRPRLAATALHPRPASATAASATALSEPQQLLQQCSSSLQQISVQLTAASPSLPPQAAQHAAAAVALLQQHALRLAARLAALQRAQTRQQQLRRAGCVRKPALIPYPLGARAPSNTRLRQIAKDGRKPAKINAQANGQEDSAAAADVDDDDGVGISAAEPARTKPADTAGSTTTQLRRRAPKAASPQQQLHSDTAQWEEAVTAAKNTSGVQRQALVREAKNVHARIAGMAQEVGQAESTLRELARMQTEIAQQLAVQEDKVKAVQSDTDSAISNVEAGNEELAQALKYNRDFRWAMLLMFVMLSLCLLLLDWIS